MMLVLPLNLVRAHQLAAVVELIRYAQGAGLFTPEVLERHRGEAHALLELADRTRPDPIALSAVRLYCETVLPDFRVCDHTHLFGPTLVREDALVRRWRAAVLERDGHACVRCGSRDRLEAHHIVRWVDAPALRIEPSNGETLCAPCHRDHHARHG